MQVVFREMADEHPDADAGDVVFVLKQQDQALAVGFATVFQHLKLQGRDGK